MTSLTPITEDIEFVRNTANGSVYAAVGSHVPEGYEVATAAEFDTHMAEVERIEAERAADSDEATKRILTRRAEARVVLVAALGADGVDALAAFIPELNA